MVANRRLPSRRFGKPVETKSPPSKARIFLNHLRASALHFSWVVEDEGMIIGIHGSSHQLYTPLTAVCLVRYQMEVGINDYQQAGTLLGLNEPEAEFLHQCATTVDKETNTRVRNEILIAIGLKEEERLSA